MTSPKTAAMETRTIPALHHKSQDAIQTAKLGRIRESISDGPVDSNFAGTRQAILSNNFEKMENLLYSSHE